MPIDKTNKQALTQLQEKYNDQIIEYEYKHWKESYLAPPPPRSFAQSMLRYRMCYKVEYIILKDGSKIKVGGLLNGVEDSQNDNPIGCLVVLLMGFFIFVCIVI